MIDQNTYDTMSKQLLLRIDYTPITFADGQINFDYMWTFVGAVRGDSKPQPVAKNESNIMIYDCTTAEWVEINPEKISSISYPFFSDCVSKLPIPMNEQVYDPGTRQFELVDIEMSRFQLNPVDVINKGMSECSDFNNSKYQSIVNNAILVADRSRDSDDDPWSVNFSSNSVDVEWVDLFEQLSLSEYDLAHGQLDIDDCIMQWKMLIEEKAVTAKEFITSQKKQLLKRDDSTTISKEEEQEIETEIQELDAISGLIDDDIRDYINMTESATNLDDLIEIWPPILLPMPYRKELVRVPIDPTAGDPVEDVDD
jgi:hypothetical protein